MFDFLFGDPSTSDHSPGRLGQVMVWLCMALILLAIVQATVPAQQASPSYDGNSWHTQIHIEDNDTNTCIGYCPDGQR